MLTKPLSQEEIIDIFGDFHPYLNQDGMSVSEDWPNLILTGINLPKLLPLSWDHNKLVSSIRCHKKIAPFLKRALDDISRIPDVWSTINDYGGCYNFRLQRKSTNKLSSHCWGIAIDLDVGDNPFGRTPKVHPIVREIFYDYGFIWGGIFAQRRVDGMHFEFADLSKVI